jgi:hypothetical protein
MPACRRSDAADGPGDVDIVGIAVDRGEKVDKLLKVHTHLIHQLA